MRDIDFSPLIWFALLGVGVTVLTVLLFVSWVLYLIIRALFF